MELLLSPACLQAHPARVLLSCRKSTGLVPTCRPYGRWPGRHVAVCNKAQGANSLLPSHFVHAQFTKHLNSSKVCASGHSSGAQSSDRTRNLAASNQFEQSIGEILSPFSEEKQNRGTAENNDFIEDFLLPQSKTPRVDLLRDRIERQMNAMIVENVFSPPKDAMGDNVVVQIGRRGICLAAAVGMLQLSSLGGTAGRCSAEEAGSDVPSGGSALGEALHAGNVPFEALVEGQNTPGAMGEEKAEGTPQAKPAGEFGFDGLGRSMEEYAVGKIVALAQSGDGAILFLGVEGYEQPMKMVVGAAEAMAVLTAAQERKAKRPVTHEAWGASLEAVGWRVAHVTISDFDKDVYFSRVILSTSRSPTTSSALPSPSRPPPLNDESSQPNGDSPSPSPPSPPPGVAPTLVDGEEVTLDSAPTGVPSSKGGAFQGGLLAKSVDVRPSDGIALALRCNAPVYVSKLVAEKVLNRGGVKAPNDGKPNPIEKQPGLQAQTVQQAPVFVQTGDLLRMQGR
eukprot:TRINITY_DN20427_c0_g5_i1.p1 TRINITY_DN20427_c0_g5~~TRINITY_DN20427_c0_g5_i1.p1  ORF type:complete len:510 (+),score=90.90 TRINITY_DN20427_c0_g5_i1:422-1951(+)